MACNFDRRAVPPLLPSPSSSASLTLSLTTLSKQERRQQFEAQVKARDELLQQQAAAVAEQQAAAVVEQQAAAVAEQQQQQQLPDTTFYAGASTAIGYQDTNVGYMDTAVGLSYAVDPVQSQLFSDAGLLSQDLFYSDQSACHCKL